MQLKSRLGWLERRLTQKEKGKKMNLLNVRFWLDNLTLIMTMSVMADSNHRYNDRWGQKSREKAENPKEKQF